MKKVKLAEEKNNKRKVENLKDLLSFDTHKAFPHWKSVSEIPYIDLVEIYQKIENTTSRIEIQEILTLFLLSILEIKKKEFIPTVLMLTNKVGTSVKKTELNLGDTTIIKAIAETYNKTLKFVKEEAKKYGELGLLAVRYKKETLVLKDYFKKGSKTKGKNNVQESGSDIDVDISDGGENLSLSTSDENAVIDASNEKKSTKKKTGKVIEKKSNKKISGEREKKSSISIQSIFKKMIEMTEISGKGANEKKIQIIKKLLLNLSSTEAKFFINQLQGKKVCTGLAEGNVRDSLAFAFSIYEIKNNPSLLSFPQSQPHEKILSSLIEEGKEKEEVEIDIDVEVEGKKFKKKKKELKNLSQEELDMGREFINKNLLLMQKGVHEMPNYVFLLGEILKEPISLSKIETFSFIVPLVPVKSMLAEPSKDFNEIAKRFGNSAVFVEHKYDGERAQIHYNKGKVEIFSRNCDNKTQRWFEVVAFLESVYGNINSINNDPKKGKVYRLESNGEEKKEEVINSFIVDAEIVAIEPIYASRDSNNTYTNINISCGDQREILEYKILPFQRLSKRKRKPDPSQLPEVPVCVFAFDIIFLNGKSLCNEDLLFRKRRLDEVLLRACKKGKVEIGAGIQVSEANSEIGKKEIAVAIKKAVADSCEGVIVKAIEGPNSHYKAGKRSKFWRKMKKDYLEGLADSFDLVLMGAYCGMGKRTGVYGGFLMGSYNTTSGKVESVCKIGTGFTEVFLDTLKKKLHSRETKKCPPLFCVPESIIPDFYFTGKIIVWEIAAADISKSPVHLCAKDMFEDFRGIALRFPRFLREREDKGMEDSTSSKSILKAYNKQFSS